jgi:hypothetical protein
VHIYIQIESFDHMFHDFKEALAQNGHQALFYDCLEPFLLKGQIKWAPTKDIRIICELFAKKERMSVITCFLLSLSQESFDYNFLIATCIENRLHYPLIYVCTQSVYEDYMMPAIKIYKEFLDVHMTFDQLEETRFMHLLLWYIRMLLKGVCLNIPIRPNVLPGIIRQLGIYFFTDQILATLLAFDIRLTLSVFREFFLMPNVDYIDSPDFHDTIGMENKKEQEMTSQMRYYIKALITSKGSRYGLKHTKENLFQFYTFEASLLDQRCVTFFKDDLIDIIQAFLENSKNMGHEGDSIFSTRFLSRHKRQGKPGYLQALLHYHGLEVPRETIFEK